MKHKIFIPFCITTFLIGGYPTFQLVQASLTVEIAQAQSIWKPFSSQDGGFRVLMPGTPTQEKRTTKTNFGSLPVNVFSVIRENEAGYLVSYLDFPRDIALNSRELNQSLSAIASGFAQGSGGKLVSQRNIRLGNFPGREIRLQFEQGVIGRGRLYLINKRMYVVMAITNKERYLTKSIEGFLNSFQLVNNSTATAPKKPTVAELNASLKQAVCSQNWSQALRIIDQMLALEPSAEARSQLLNYRSQIQNIVNSGSKIPPQLLPDCNAGR
jgi:hypothetical protein